MTVVKGRCHSAEVAVDLVLTLGLFEGVHVALVVVNDPREDRVGAKIVKATTRELVQLEKQFLVLNFTIETRVEQVVLFESVEGVNDLEAPVLVLVDNLKVLEESLLADKVTKLNDLSFLSVVWISRPMSKLQTFRTAISSISRQCRINVFFLPKTDYYYT